MLIMHGDDALASSTYSHGTLTRFHSTQGCFKPDDVEAWPGEYHMAMAEGCDLARTQPPGALTDAALRTCHVALTAAVARAGREREREQILADRCEIRPDDIHSSELDCACA
jgi:hypothetical protein